MFYVSKFQNAEISQMKSYYYYSAYAFKNVHLLSLKWINTVYVFITKAGSINVLTRCVMVILPSKYIRRNITVMEEGIKITSALSYIKLLFDSLLTVR